MKPLTVVFAVVLGLFLGTSIGVAEAHRTVTDAPAADVKVPALTPSASVTIPDQGVLEVGEITIVAPAPRHVARKPAHQVVCSPVQYVLGGTIQNCR